MTHGIILYGPPGAGKDTITSELHKIDPACELFARLKAGSGRTSGYRMTTAEEIDTLRSSGAVVWENQRYEAIYVVDKPSLRDSLADHIPVLHLGQVKAIDTIVRATPDSRWLLAYVWCPRHVAAARLAARGTGDVSARLLAWDETRSIQHAHLTINTEITTAAEAAQGIHDILTKHFLSGAIALAHPRRSRPGPPAVIPT